MGREGKPRGEWFGRHPRLEDYEEGLDSVNYKRVLREDGWDVDLEEEQQMMALERIAQDLNTMHRNGVDLERWNGKVPG